MAKVCIFKSPNELHETMTVKDFENLMGIGTSAAYPFVKEKGIALQIGDCCRIQINKNAVLRLIGYVPLVLTPELTSTPLVWDVEDIAKYLNKHWTTVYEYVRKWITRPNHPFIRIGKRIKVCREAFLKFWGYVEPVAVVDQMIA